MRIILKSLLISVTILSLLSGCTSSNVLITKGANTIDSQSTSTVKLQSTSIIMPQSSDAIKPQSDDKIELYKETKHFLLYSNKKDKLLVDVLSEALENGYDRISKDLACTLKEKVVVRIYPDIETFHKGIGKPDAPSWYIGEGSGGVISITADMTNYLASDVIIHELTHIITSNNFGPMPQWLFQGIAKYEGKETPIAYIESAVRAGVSSQKIPTLKDLDTDYMSFVDKGGYEYSYVAIEYILAEYGHDKLVKLLRSPYNYMEVFGITEDEFNNNWLEYVRKNY